MSERKVLNKYYPPDFDPTKIPKLRMAKNRNFGIRLMAPFNMRCNTCGEYIYKGKKFNSQKETVEDKNYLGLHIFRFYIKCPKCIAVIAFRTDPETTDYVLEAGATRNFEAARTAELQAVKEQKEKEAELQNNPMKVLENRTLKSQQEIEMIETLEELRQIKKTQNEVDTLEVIKKSEGSAKELAEQIAKQQEEEDEKFIRSMFQPSALRRLEPDDDDKGTERNEDQVDKAPKRLKRDEEWLSTVAANKQHQSEILKNLKTHIKKKGTSKEAENKAEKATEPTSTVVRNGIQETASVTELAISKHSASRSSAPGAQCSETSMNSKFSLVHYSDESDSDD